jgi:hypothetical protein
MMADPLENVSAEDLLLVIGRLYMSNLLLMRDKRKLEVEVLELRAALIQTDDQEGVRE